VLRKHEYLPLEEMKAKRTFKRNGAWGCFQTRTGESRGSFAASAFQARLILGAVVELLRCFDRQKIPRLLAE